MKTKGFLSATLLMMFFLFCGSIFAQQVTITGTIIDANDNEPLVGASIYIKNTNKGTVSNIDGKYSIEAKKGDYLVFLYVGYVKEEVEIGDKKEINVALKQDTRVLEEISVIGYEKVKEKIFTGSASSVSSDQLSKRPVSSAGYAVTGRTSGVNVNGNKDIRIGSYYNYGNNEDYNSISENGFKRVIDEPLSTFSADVDVASYSNFRRYVNQGQLPPKDAVRIEEFINYFTYDYQQPTGKDPVKITAEVGECAWNSQHRLVKIGLKAKEIPGKNLPASNFVFLIDVSGSMFGPTRLELVKSSMKLLINNLRDKDRVAIVVYAGRAGEVLPSTSGGDKQKIKEALDNLTAGGSTAGGAGIKLAYEIAKKNFIKGGNNRIILCTDGDFNVGVSSKQGLEDMVAAERQSGVFLSVLGYGMGNYKDSKMQTLAEKGNGNAAYIDNLQEANKVLVNEFGSTMYTVAKDVKLQIEFNPAKVQAYRLVGYESRLLNKEDFNDDTKDAGEMGAGHTVTALYEVVPVGVKSNLTPNVDDLKYQINSESKSSIKHTNSPELLTIKLRYKLPDEDKSSKIELPLVDKGGNNVSSDFKFVSAVTMFTQLLRNSSFKGDASYEKAISLAKDSYGEDKQGYRREFVRLAEVAKGLK